MRIVATIILAAALVQAQTPTQPPAPNQQAQPQPSTQPGQPDSQEQPTPPSQAKPEDLAPSTPVLTLEGFCEKPPTEGGECKTVMTKAEFEKLADALNPRMAPPVKRQLATTYAQMLVLSKAAEQRGLTKTPAADKVLEFARLQALSQLMVQNLQEEAAKVPPEEVEQYHRAHAGQFEEATLRRIFIPKAKAGDKPGEPVRLEEATVKAEVAKIQAAAAAKASDFSKLQKQAYADLGVKMEPPSAEPITMMRDQMLPEHVKVFDLQPGTASQAFEEPGGFYIYRVESKRTIPLETAKAQIERTLQQQRIQSAMQQLTKGINPQLNPAYFGAAAEPGAMGNGAGPGPGEAPPKPAAKPGSSPPSTSKPATTSGQKPPPKKPAQPPRP